MIFFNPACMVLTVMGYTTHISLLARITEGVDPAAWKEFHQRYFDLIRSFARRYGLQPADCDDVTQDVLLSLSRSLEGFRYDPAKGRFRAYLKTVTLRAIFKNLRQKGGHTQLEDIGEEEQKVASDAAVEAVWEEEWQRHHIRMAMQRLEKEYSERDRMVFSQYAMKNRPAAETAEALGISVDQVYQAKSKILKRLGELIAEQVEDEG